MTTLVTACTPAGIGEHSQPDIQLKYYPTTSAERAHFVNPNTGRRITSFQFKVYDLCAQIPVGKFSTYKELAKALGKMAPQAIGQALKQNPFAPLPVPCHRVLASNFYLGGFSGDWGSGKCNDKRGLLAAEGIRFDMNDIVVVEDQRHCLFVGFSSVE
ncbi:hypothetical protein IWQ61_000504 [Dispira simplex]|nr:hypothetical protein IWQ61_000504 [Dispira simplex]